MYWHMIQAVRCLGAGILSVHTLPSHTDISQTNPKLQNYKHHLSFCQSSSHVHTWEKCWECWKFKFTVTCWLLLRFRKCCYACCMQKVVKLRYILTTAIVTDTEQWKNEKCQRKYHGWRKHMSLKYDQSGSHIFRIHIQLFNFTIRHCMALH